MRHPAGHVQIDHTLRGGGLFGLGGTFKRCGETAWRQGAHDGDAQAGLGDVLGEIAAAWLVAGVEEVFHGVSVCCVNARGGAFLPQIAANSDSPRAVR